MIQSYMAISAIWNNPKNRCFCKKIFLSNFYFSDDKDQDQELKELLEDIPDEELLPPNPKPKKERKQRKKNLSNGLSREEKDLITKCEKFMEKYPNCANLSIPNEDNPEKKAYESFVVPSGNLEAYKSLPKVSLNLFGVANYQQKKHFDF